jgi:cupin fold WbuC family metalloprotein
MMNSGGIEVAAKRQKNAPNLSLVEIGKNLRMAADSPRRRHPKVLHRSGADLNQVVNFLMEDTYMQPHMHPSQEKVERMHLIQGACAVLFFSSTGSIKDAVVLQKYGVRYIEVPAFTWHTYVILSENAVIYETMMGRYDPATWKTFADWAPSENDFEADNYLRMLQSFVKKAWKCEHVAGC